MRLLLVLFFLTSYFISNSLCQTSIPSYVNLCKQSDPNLDNCVISTIKAMTPYLAKGIPEMRIVPLEPFQISTLKLRNSNSLEVELNEVQVRNILTFQIKRFHMDVKNVQIELDIHFPKIDIEGQYKLQGHILIFDLNGSGDSTLNFTNADVKIKISGKRKQKTGKEFFDFNHADVDMKSENLSFNFEDLFQENKELTEKTNAVLNENSQAIISEFLPIVSKTLQNIILLVVKNVFDTFPINELLPI